jgi:hypothetical protein
MRGLLDGINRHLEPETLAEIAERKRRIDIVAAQMGCSRHEAALALDWFVESTSSEGQTVH